MMTEIIFISGITLFVAILFTWGFKNLPKDSWQFVAAVPLKRKDDGRWRAFNMTYYGFFSATAYSFAVSILFVLAVSAGVSVPGIIISCMVILGVAMPAARWIARVVENKPYTFTVGGASFAGILIAPWVILLVGKLHISDLNTSIPMIPGLAAASIAYAFGEGIGRLACVSFGCCYGKPMKDTPLWLQKIIRYKGFVFTGKTKKISYADQMDGEAIFPVQAVTAVLYTGTGILGVIAFLFGWYIAALLITLSITQIWRAVSEILRADFRGQNKISAYQLMAVIGVVYIAMILPFINVSPVEYVRPDLSIGLACIWSPGIILFLQGLWVVSFVYTGKSDVTTSDIGFDIVNTRI